MVSAGQGGGRRWAGAHLGRLDCYRLGFTLFIVLIYIIFHKKIANFVLLGFLAIFITINEQKSGLFVKMHKRELSNHSQKSRLLPTIFCKVKNK